MNLRKKLLADCSLYAILDTEVLKRKDISKVALACIRGGADIVQLRDKIGTFRQMLDTTFKIKPFFKNIPLIINDRVDILLATDTDGVHLGEEDMPVDIARRIVGKNKIIGFSADTLQKAKDAIKKGADYLGVGPAFSTPTKQGESPIDWKVYIQLNRKIQRPYFAIGGINLNNVQKLIKIDIKRICVTRAVCSSIDPEARVRELKNYL